MSGGYDINLFASPPNCKFLCSICHAVLKRPVRLPCSHIFCKKCIFQWLARQNTCPCCRKEVKRRKIVYVNKLRKTIGHLKVKCKNAEAGCLVTCRLAHHKRHQDSCPFEPMACPNEGCSAQVSRGTLAEHRQHCQQGSNQHCPLGCGATLGMAELAHYNCYLKLQEAWSERQERSQTLLQGLLRHVRRVHHTSSLIHKKLAQLSHLLGDDATREANTLTEGSVGAEALGVQGQGSLEIEG